MGLLLPHTGVALRYTHTCLNVKQHLTRCSYSAVKVCGCSYNRLIGCYETFAKCLGIIFKRLFDCLAPLIAACSYISLWVC